MGNRDGGRLASVAAAAAAAAAARRHRRRGEAAGGLQTAHRQLAHHVRARARGTRDGGRRTREVLLELILPMLAAVVVGRHQLLTAALDVALHALLGLLFSNLV